MGGDLMDGIVSRVLNSSNKPEEVTFHVSQSEILLMNSDKKEVNIQLWCPQYIII